MKVIKGIDKGVLEEFLTFNEEFANAIKELKKVASKALLSGSIKSNKMFKDLVKNNRLTESIGNLTLQEFDFLASMPESEIFVQLVEVMKEKEFVKSKYDPFDKKDKKKEKTKDESELTKLEEKLYKFCRRKGINLNQSITGILIDAEEHGFRNLKGKRVLNRSTVGKMKLKIQKGGELK